MHHLRGRSLLLLVIVNTASLRFLLLEFIICVELHGGEMITSQLQGKLWLYDEVHGLESVEARLTHYKKNEAVFEESINVLKLEVKLRDNALDEYKMNLEKAEKERDELRLTLKKFQNSSKSLNDLLESQVIDKFKTGLGYNAATATSPAVESFMNSSDKSGSDKGYHAVPLPLTGNFIPRKPDLTFIDEIVKSKNMDVTTVVTPGNDKTVENKGVSNTVESNDVRMNNSSTPIIEDWNSDDESEIDYTVRPSTEKIKSIKTVREIDAPKHNKHHPKENQINWNNLMSQRLGSNFKMINKACFVCGSFEHLHYVCDKKVVRPVWNNSRSVNHKNFSNKMTHPHPKRSFVPQAVLTRTGKINIAGTNVNTAGASINTATSTPIMNHPRPKSNAFKRGYSQSSRPFNRYYANKYNINVNTAKVKNTTAKDRAVGNPQQKEYKEKAVINSGCSRHMTGNKCYLDEYEDYDGGFVSFGDGKGIISRKGKIKTRSLDFNDVYFCKELKYNLFSVSQICDKKNNVLFTDTECLVLSSDFKLLDESQVLLRVPRKENIYNVNLKSVNGVAERKNRTLIEAVRTMLVDSKLLTTFWAKAVNTACYVLNRVLVIKPHNKTPYELIRGRPPLIEAARTMVLVIKPHNKTPYELIRGRPPLIDFLKPFGRPVTILNTRDHLCKIVEETLNIRFLENTPNVKGNGPDWLFDVDSLTISMNYVPVVTGNQTNSIARTKDNIVAVPKECEGDAGIKPTKVDKRGASDKNEKDAQDTRSESERLNQREMQTKHTNSTNSVNTVSTVGPSFDNAVSSPPVNTAGPSVSTANAFEEHLFE
ncbi:ribonuclease H-like domain-containing protein [Tanacetum coccineum]